MSLIFETIEQWQADTPWGHFLDSGTGDHSLKWALGVDAQSFTAITGSQDHYNELEKAHSFSEDQKLVLDNWTNNSLLEGEIFDTILADYLLGAIDGFSPYFQSDLLPRLKRHLSKDGTLYFIGLEPFPDYSNNTGDSLVIRMAKLRDACILLAGHRCYREYPLEWVQSELVKNGFKIEKTKPFLNQFGMPFVTSQLNVARSKLPYIKDDTLAKTLEGHIQALEEEIASHVDDHGPISFGFDYLIQARLLEGKN